MTKHDLEFIEKCRRTFADTAPMSMAELRKIVEAQAEGIVRRDMLSGIDAIRKLFTKDLSSLPATTRSLREFFLSVSAAQAGVSTKRFANIRSSVFAAHRAYREEHRPITKRIPLTAEWAELLAPLTKLERIAMNRLAAFGSATITSPKALSATFLLGYVAALEEEEGIKQPKNMLTQAVTAWNRMSRRYKHWPRYSLKMPYEREVLCLPLTDFPKSFQKQLSSWKEEMVNPDPLDLNQPEDALRPATAEWKKKVIIRFASVLVRSGHLKVRQITNFKVLMDLPNFKAGLRFYRSRFDNKKTNYIGAMAHSLVSIAKHNCDLSADHLKDLKKLAKNLQPKNVDPLTPRNRQRLAQFDNPENVMKLLTFPARERARGLKEKNLERRAKYIERAVIGALFIHCKLRIETLRKLELEDFTRGANGETRLFVKGEKMKTGSPLEFELPQPAADLLWEFVRSYRVGMPGAKGPYLFPGKTGGPRYHSSIRARMTKSMKQYAGLDMNPHLFRHALTKIVFERSPDLLTALSKQLGHKNIETTLKYYMGTEQRAAGRHIDRILSEAIENGGHQ